ncbi:MAG: hypothetical protein HPY76_09740 [Anaerolineae bacterium]|nr:hypothetical protein [Anaerolineae bacterium]
MKTLDVVGLGLATLDILTLTPRLPRSNECFPIDHIEMQGGGPVATALVALARLGASCAYLGVAAPDQSGRQIVAELEQYRVDVTSVVQRAHGASSASVILVERDSGHRAILFREGTAPDLHPHEVPQELITSARALHLDGFALPAAVKAAQLARESATLVSFDGGAGERMLDGLGQLLPLVDVMVLARQFALNLCGYAQPIEACQAILNQYHPRQVVITDGERGCWYADDTTQIHQPAYPVAVVDSTGAGDTFHGAYLFACLQLAWTPSFRLKFASAVAALKCTQLGGRTGIPTYDQTMEFLSTRGEELL